MNCIVLRQVYPELKAFSKTFLIGLFLHHTQIDPFALSADVFGCNFCHAFIFRSGIDDSNDYDDYSVVFPASLVSLICFFVFGV